MFDFLFSTPMLLLGAFFCGMFFKSMILDKIRGYVVAKVAPGIIKKYLEEALGMNQDVLPAMVKVVAVEPVVAVTAVEQPAPVAVAPVEAPVAPPAA